MKEDDPGSLDKRIAARVRALRAEQGLSLEAVSAKCGVSRSMISLIERGETSPTAVVLEKLAAGLGVTLAALFDAPAAAGRDHASSPLARRAEQAEWTDPGSGYRRRNVSSAGIDQPVQIVDVEFPAGARVAFDIGARDIRVTQQVWVLAGRMEVTVGSTRHELATGDCLYMSLEQPIVFHNPSGEMARYAVVLHTDTPRRR